MVEVVFLGTGAAVPSKGETNASYLVKAGEVALLIDCGPAILQQLAMVDRTPGDITHIFITHRHGDHTLGYPLFLLWWLMHPPGPKPLPTTIASDVTWESLQALTAASYGELLDSLNAAPRVMLPARDSGSWRLNDTITLHACPLAHSEFAPVLGVRVQIGDTVLAFTGDTGPCENIISLARDADLLVHDATFSESIETQYAGGAYGHCTAAIAGRNAAAARVKHLVLTHIAPQYHGKHAQLIEEASREFDGLVSIPEAGDAYSF
jgi:ribonuclease Z